MSTTRPAGAEVAVRDAVLGDAAAVSRVQVRSWQAAYRGIAPDDFLDALSDDEWLDRWEHTLGRPPRQGVHQLVATVDDRVVAVAAAGPAREPEEGVTGELYLLYALPAVWGDGHGGALLREVHRRLRADGHDAALLWVAAANERSTAFYEHLGWRLDGATTREDVGGVEFDEARMVRDLSRD